MKNRLAAAAANDVPARCQPKSGALFPALATPNPHYSWPLAQITLRVFQKTK
jgi:hypothetical protein